MFRSKRIKMSGYVASEVDVHEKNNSSVSLYAWCVWGLAAFFFFAEYFARVAPAVMMEDLLHSLMISATGFGSITSSFYWTYIPMQIPVGLMVDRFSVRWLMASMAFLTAVSCAVFATSIGLAMACFSRLLLGFGAAFAFVGALKTAAMWFPPRMVGMLAGFTQALGMLGAASGALPVAYLVEKFGWRRSLWGIAFGFVILAVLIAAIVRDKPVSQTKVTAKGSHTILDSLRTVLSNPQSWWNAVFSGFLFVPTAVLGESWGVEYLKSAHHLTHHQAAWCNGMIFIGWGIGGPLVGMFSDRIGRRKIVMLASATLSLIAMSVLVWGPSLTFTQITVLLLLFGLFNTGVGVSYALATEINPKRDGGVSIAFANMGSILIGAICLPFVGTLIDWHSQAAGAGLTYSGDDFQYAMNILPISLIVSIIFCLLVKETNCQPVE